MFTNHRLVHFTELDSNCLYCHALGIRVLEDNRHLFLDCPRTVDLFRHIIGILRLVSNIHSIEKVDLVLGKMFDCKYQTACFNLIVQYAQLALWRARCEYNEGNIDISPPHILKTELFRTLCRLKVYLKEPIFWN